MCRGARPEASCAPPTTHLKPRQADRGTPGLVLAGALSSRGGAQASAHATGGHAAAGGRQAATGHQLHAAACMAPSPAAACPGRQRRAWGRRCASAGRAWPRPACQRAPATAAGSGTRLGGRRAQGAGCRGRVGAGATESGGRETTQWVPAPTARPCCSAPASASSTATLSSYRAVRTQGMAFSASSSTAVGEPEPSSPLLPSPPAHRRSHTRAHTLCSSGAPTSTSTGEQYSVPAIVRRSAAAAPSALPHRCRAQEARQCSRDSRTQSEMVSRHAAVWTLWAKIQTFERARAERALLSRADAHSGPRSPRGMSSTAAWTARASARAPAPAREILLMHVTQLAPHWDPEDGRG